VVCVFGGTVAALLGYAAGGEGGGILLGVLVVFVLFGGYWVYLEGRPSGQTFGMRLLGIRVRAVSGSRAGYGRALARNTAMFGISFFVPPAFLLDLLWPLWDPRKQCLHDKIASTIAVPNG